MWLCAMWCWSFNYVIFLYYLHQLVIGLAIVDDSHLSFSLNLQLFPCSQSFLYLVYCAPSHFSCTIRFSPSYLLSYVTTLLFKNCIGCWMFFDKRLARVQFWSCVYVFVCCACELICRSWMLNTYLLSLEIAVIRSCFQRFTIACVCICTITVCCSSCPVPPAHQSLLSVLSVTGHYHHFSSEVTLSSHDNVAGLVR